MTTTATRSDSISADVVAAGFSIAGTNKASAATNMNSPTPNDARLRYVRPPLIPGALLVVRPEFVLTIEL